MHSVMFFFSSRRRHTRLVSDWSSDVCSSDLNTACRISVRKPGWHKPCPPEWAVRKPNGCQSIGWPEPANHRQPRMQAMASFCSSTMEPSGTYRLLSKTIVSCYGRDDALRTAWKG